MDDTYIYVITALLPLAACMVVVQKNPYHALVIRGILGAVAALVYAVLGAADVALTEALVGTMLAITLYAVAVRSSMNMRLGLLKEDLARLQGPGTPIAPPPEVSLPVPSQAQALESLLGHLRPLLKKRHLRLELLPYDDIQTLEAALAARDIHGICLPMGAIQPNSGEDFPSFGITTRIRRLYDLMQAELPMLAASLTYVNPTESPPSGQKPANPPLSTTEEVTP